MCAPADYVHTLSHVPSPLAAHLAWLGAPATIRIQRMAVTSMAFCHGEPELLKEAVWVLPFQWSDIRNLAKTLDMRCTSWEVSRSKTPRLGNERSWGPTPAHARSMREFEPQSCLCRKHVAMYCDISYPTQALSFDLQPCPTLEVLGVEVCALVFKGLHF